MFLGQRGWYMENLSLYEHIGKMTRKVTTVSPRMCSRNLRSREMDNLHRVRWGRIILQRTWNWVSERVICCLTSHATIFQLYMWRHIIRCAGGLKKNLLYLWSGSQRHRHFTGFFNVPVQAPTRDHPIQRNCPFCRLLQHTGDTEDVFSSLTPQHPYGGTRNCKHRQAYHTKIRCNTKICIIVLIDIKLGKHCQWRKDKLFWQLRSDIKGQVQL